MSNKTNGDKAPIIYVVEIIYHALQVLYLLTLATQFNDRIYTD